MGFVAAAITAILGANIVLARNLVRGGARRARAALAVVTILALDGGSGFGGLALYRYYNHTTPEEAAGEVVHTTRAMELRGRTLTLQVYRCAATAPHPLFLFTSGDGGWSPFCADVAAHVALGGRTAVGVDVKEYMTTFATPDRPLTPGEIAGDYAAIVDEALRIPGVDPGSKLVLSGWSLGAGYSVVAASDPQVHDLVENVVAIALPEYNELAWQPLDSVIYVTHGVPDEKLFNVKDYIAQLGGIPLLMFEASSDRLSPIAEARHLYDAASQPKQLFVIDANGHHFEGGEATFYAKLDGELGIPEGQAPVFVDTASG